MAFEDCTVYRVWDHERRDWWTPHTRARGTIKFWDTEEDAKSTMSRKITIKSGMNLTKEEAEERFSIIECHVVPKPHVMAQFKEL